MQDCDAVIVGGGILGVSIAYWLSSLHEGRIVLLEKEPRVAMHSSWRNTGVVHRPFYLHPEKKQIFAKCSQIAYSMWKTYAESKGLPWLQIGTLKAAGEDEHWRTLEGYLRWGLANGMDDSELELLARAEVKKIEPKVECAGALYCKTETAVAYRAFTESLRQDAEKAGATFLHTSQVKEIRAHSGKLHVVIKDNRKPLVSSFLVNCAGGNSVDLAHMMNLGREFTDLHFRGEYWTVEDGFGHSIRTNVYSIPTHREMPFLDPHFIVRVDGRREIGPNAVPVGGSETYSGLASSPSELFSKLFESPVANKARLLFNSQFLSLVRKEWTSSLSKRSMAERIRKLIPDLKHEHLIGKGTAGIRSAVLDRRGNFMSEAVELTDENSCHILNYNSPGATGAPAYAAYIVNRLIAKGFLDHLKRKKVTFGHWDFDAVAGNFN